MADTPQWEVEGLGWPNREASEFVDVGTMRWHVQKMGRGPTLLMLHGTGAATHSWRDFAPALAERFSVVALDLPGHGFTRALPLNQMSLSGMSAAIGALLGAIDCSPTLAVGHSAGAAILVRMAFDGVIAPRALVSLNGALMPWRGIPSHLFAPVAKIMATSLIAAHALAWRARDRYTVERLLATTGSRLDPSGVDLYQRLLRCPGHVRASLAMMSNWDLGSLTPLLPHLAPPLFLLVGEADYTVPPSEARRVRERLPSAEISAFPGLGHLAHEERPQELAAWVERLGARLELFA